MNGAMPGSLESPAEALGRQAAVALREGALSDAFARLERDVVEAWRSSPPHEQQAREWLYLRLCALGAVKEELRLLVDEGRLAERERLRQDRESRERRIDGLAAGDPP
jgi:hypothetical protein